MNEPKYTVRKVKGRHSIIDRKRFVPCQNWTEAVFILDAIAMGNADLEKLPWYDLKTHNPIGDWASEKITATPAVDAVRPIANDLTQTDEDAQTATECRRWLERQGV